MGDWSRMDRKIKAAEEEQLRAMNLREDTIEQYFTERNRKRLSTMRISEMTNDDVYILDELRKGDNIPATNTQDGTTSLEDQKRQAYQLISQIMNHPNCDKDTFNGVQKVANLINSLELTDTTNTQEKPEEISNEPEVSVSKGLEIRKSSGATLVSGWSGVEEIDWGGDILTIDEMKKSLEHFYLNNAKICLQHDVNNVIGKLRSYEIKKTKDGKLGVYVIAEITNPHIESQIKNGILKGFSWSFSANRERKCEKDRCYQNLKMIPNSIKELSIVDYPCNPGAIIDGLHHSS